MEYLLSQLASSVTWLGFFSAIFLAYYHYLKFRNKEKMLLIEKGADITEIYKRKDWSFPWYILGFIILGCSIGLVFGLSSTLLIETMNIETQTPYAPILHFSLMFLCGSIGLIVGNMFERKNRK